MARTALALIHENEVRSTRREAVFPTVLALFLGGVCVAYRVEFGSPFFLFFALAALWSAGLLYRWWRLRRRGPIPDAEAAQVLAAREAHDESVREHQAVLAARPPRLTWGLLGCIVAASAFQLVDRRSSFDDAALVKDATRAGEWWRLLTAAYLHGGIWHLWVNVASLRALGPLVEAYAPRSRLPLVWLVSALAGSVASLVLMPHTTSVGASGGIMGLVGYLWMMSRRRPHELPRWLGKGLTMTIGLNALLGVLGYGFIDNAAHAGGAIAGALIGVATIPRATPDTTPDTVTPRDDTRDVVDALGWLSACVIVLGALLTISKLMR